MITTPNEKERFSSLAFGILFSARKEEKALSASSVNRTSLNVFKILRWFA
jgi:hypothetical protein